MSPQMKGVRERLVRKLKSITTVSTLKQSLVFEVNPQIQTKDQKLQNDNLCDRVTCKTTLFDFINHVKDEDIDLDSHVSSEPGEALGSSLVVVKDHKELATIVDYGSHDDVSTAALPEETQSLTIAKICNLRQETVPKADHNTPASSKLVAFHELDESDESKEHASLFDFEEKCPPEGKDSVILYTTSMRGIRKTFEDCNAIKFLLESLSVVYVVRDVSMHMEFREELWRVLGGRVLPPRLFIRGRHIGGADEAGRLHEQGKLRKLLEGIPITVSNHPCQGCAGVRFVLCVNCNGSRKINVGEEDCEVSVRCPECNENGLVQCPLCS